MTAHDDVAQARVDALGEAWGRGPWEPWRPDVGQRVRCVPSPECRVQGSRRSSPAQRNGLPFGHHPDEYGMTGVVILPGSFPAPDAAHRHRVLWDRSIRLPNGERPNCNAYAAIELEPISPQSSAADEEPGA